MDSPRNAMVPTLLSTALTPMVWGTSYIVATELMPADRPLLTAALRARPVGLVLSASARTLPTGSWWWRTAVLGTLNIGAFFALLFVSAYRLPGGVAAVLGAMSPLVVAGLTVGLSGSARSRRFRRCPPPSGSVRSTGAWAPSGCASGP